MIALGGPERRLVAIRVARGRTGDALLHEEEAVAIERRHGGHPLAQLTTRLALEPDDARPTDWTVPLLPSLRQQARAALQALAGALRERTGVEVEVQSNDDGILFRFPEADADVPLDLLTAVGPDEARARILAELPNSAVFGAQFRQNAARALLLPGQRGKRTPFWLQRLRAKDLLQLVRGFEDFPIVAETYRDCLEEVMDWPNLARVLERIQRGEIQVTAVETILPSP